MPRIIQYRIAVLLFLGLFLQGKSAFAGSKEELADSLKQVLLTQQEDTLRIKTLIKISQAYLALNKDSAMKYAMQLKREAEASDSLSHVCDAYVIVGSCFNLFNEEDSAMYYKRKSYALAKEINYVKGIANGANDIGLYLKENGDYDSAIYYVLESITIREANRIEKPLGVSYNNLGLIYQVNGDTTNAMIYFRKADEISAKFKDFRVRTVVIGNIAAVYDDMHKYDSAMYYYRISLTLCDSLEDAKGMSRVLSNMGVVYRNLGELETSESFLLDALRIKDSISDKTGIAIASYELAETYRAMAKFDESVKLLLRADTLAQSLRSKDLQRDVYYAYAQVYKETNRPELALEYYEKYNELNRQILNEEKINAIEEMRTRYGTVKKERENAQLREQQLEEARQRRILIAGMFTLIIVLGLAVYAYRTKIKSNMLLEVKNEQIQKQNSTLKELNKKLIESEEELTVLNQTKDELFSIISHDLGNPVNAIVNYNSVLRSQKETLTKEEMAQSLDKVNLTLQPLQGFLDNLLHWSILQRNGIVVRKEDVNVKDVVGEIVALYQASLLTKRVTVQTEVSPSLSAHTDKNILRLIVRNLVGNAIKFSPTGETVHVKAFSENSRVVLEVRNSGNPIPADKIASILDGKRVSSSRGSLEEQGTGLGLSLVSQYLKAMESEMKIESSNNETRIKIIL